MLLAAFAATTFAQAAFDAFRCRDGAMAQPVVAVSDTFVVCRNVRFLGIDTAQGIAQIALGPLIAADSAGIRTVPLFPYGMVCSTTILQKASQ